jgi:hypothetical protein
MGNGRSKAAARYLGAFDSEDDGDATGRMYSEPLLGDARDAKQHNLQALDSHPSDAVSLAAVLHQLDSFYAVLWPVAAAMILTRYCWRCPHGPTMALTALMNCLGSAAACLLSDPQTAKAMR